MSECLLASKVCGLIYGAVVQCLQLWASQRLSQCLAFGVLFLPAVQRTLVCLSFCFQSSLSRLIFGLLSKLWISARSSRLVGSTGKQWATTASSSEKGQARLESTDFFSHINLSRK